MRYVGYCRISRLPNGNGGAADEAASLVAQRERLNAEAGRRGWELVHVEDVASGGKREHRPGLDEALRLVREKEAAGIMVAKLDRLSRSVIDFANILEQARKEGWNVVALDLGVDLSTPAGELVANVMAAVAQWERRAISERTKAGLAVKRAQGVKIGRPARVPGWVVKEIVKMRRDGLMLFEIVDRLEAAGIRTSTGKDRWTKGTVDKLLRRTMPDRPRRQPPYKPDGTYSLRGRRELREERRAQ